MDDVTKDAGPSAADLDAVAAENHAADATAEPAAEPAHEEGKVAEVAGAEVEKETVASSTAPAAEPAPLTVEERVARLEKDHADFKKLCDEKFGIRPE